MVEVNHQRIQTNGIWMHIAEQGTGPLILLLHHQLNHLAHHGSHAVAPDLRGYGDSDSPLSPYSYTILHLVGDLIGLLDNFGQQRTFAVGSDWGAIIGWYLSLFRPDRVKGLVVLSVPYFPRNPTVKTVESYCKRFGYENHVSQFQEPGRAEKAFARYDCLTVMKKFLLINKTEALVAPPGMEIIDFLPTPSILPSWITEEDLVVYADKFQETGFTAPRNYYRAMDLNWELLAPWQGSKITVPTKFIAGDKDMGFESSGTKEYVQESCSQLRSSYS